MRFIWPIVLGAGYGVAFSLYFGTKPDALHAAGMCAAIVAIDLGSHFQALRMSRRP